MKNKNTTDYLHIISAEISEAKVAIEDNLAVWDYDNGENQSVSDARAAAVVEIESFIMRIENLKAKILISPLAKLRDKYQIEA